MTTCSKTSTMDSCGFCCRPVENSSGGTSTLNLNDIFGGSGDSSKKVKGAQVFNEGGDGMGGEGEKEERVSLVSQFLVVLQRFDFDKSGGKLESRKEKFENEEERKSFADMKFCGHCSEILGSVCSLYHEIKCLEMQLHGKLGKFREVMMEATPKDEGGAGGGDKVGEDGNPSKTTKTDGGDGDPSFLNNQGAGFREKIVNRLTRIMSTVPPRVVLEEEATSGGSQSQSVDEHSTINIPTADKDPVKVPMDPFNLAPFVGTTDHGYEEVGDFPDCGSCSGDSMDVNWANDVELIPLEDSDDDGPPTAFDILSLPGSPKNMDINESGELNEEKSSDVKVEDPVPLALGDALPDCMSTQAGPSKPNFSGRFYKSGLIIKVGQRVYLDRLTRMMLHKRQYLKEHNDQMPMWGSRYPPSPPPETDKQESPPETDKQESPPEEDGKKAYDFRSRGGTQKEVEEVKFQQPSCSKELGPIKIKRGRGRPRKIQEKKEEEEASPPPPRTQRKSLPNRKYRSN